MTKITEDMFNLDNLSDLPTEYQQKLKIKKFRNHEKLLLEFFNVRPTLTLDELMAAFWRAYKEEKGRAWFSSTLRVLANKNLVRKVEGTKDEWEKI